MDLTASWISIVIGFFCGIISGFGVGGGSLLMVWMTAAVMLEQRTAQGINLLYFIPTSISALVIHIKNKMVCWKAVIPAVLFGCLTAAGSAWIASSIDGTVLRKLFGAFLLIVGISEICKKKNQNNVT